MTELCDRSAVELSAAIAAGEVTAAQVLESSLARIQAVDGRVGAILTPTSQLARERAAKDD